MLVADGDGQFGGVAGADHGFDILDASGGGFFAEGRFSPVQAFFGEGGGERSTGMWEPEWLGWGGEKFVVGLVEGEVAGFAGGDVPGEIYGGGVVHAGEFL